MPALLSTDDFPRVFSEPLGILFLDAILKLLRFLLQILKFFNLVIVWQLVGFMVPLLNRLLELLLAKT